MTAQPDREPALAFRVLITGSRDWDDRARIDGALRQVYDDAEGLPIVLVSGACPTGADAFCEHFAKRERWPIESHPAEWGRYGRSAGYKRNAEMVALGADLCLAFIRDNSKGATHTAEQARKAGIETRIYRAH